MPLIFQRKDFEISKAAVGLDRKTSVEKYPELSVYYILEHFRLTQKEMARRLGYSQTLISDYINNQRRLSPRFLNDIETTFPVLINDFGFNLWKTVHLACARREGWDV